MGSSTADLSRGDVGGFISDSFRFVDEGIAIVDGRARERVRRSELARLADAEREREQTIRAGQVARNAEQRDASMRAGGLRRRAEASRRANIGQSMLGFEETDLLGL